MVFRQWYRTRYSRKLVYEQTQWLYRAQRMPTDIARYSIELFKLGGEGAGIEEILDRHADLKIARSIYRTRVEEHPGRLIMLCDHARVLARSDQPELR
jgi:hypothetical protein